jgi:hypothetical protein
MANRGLMARIPIWVRVPGIIALVLVGVLISTMLLGAWGDGDGHGSGGSHGSGDEPEMMEQNRGQGGGHDSGDRSRMRDHDEGQGGGHDSGDRSRMRDHNGGQRETVAPPERTPRDGGRRLQADGDRGTASSARMPFAAATRTDRSCRRRSARKHRARARNRCRRGSARAHHS